ncbi:hypothetical protein CVT24_004764 [Panaeolus cyanescens]|uniref:Uncharacterized protein n=1 Tax=Panaeolus cyanescens TaxID=181874 RepID=A0A409X3L0_9AGAR|nr:hypothetical protein CVT24_004764 [Panaeolus cyanescens]
MILRLYSTLLAHPTHLNDIHRADTNLIATHSQGSVVSTHILDRLIKDGHIGDDRQGDVLAIGGEVYPGLPSSSSTPSTSTTPANDGKKPDGLPPADLDAPPLSVRTTSSASAFDDSKPRKPQHSGWIANLSEATAGSLSGVGHSTAYEELATYVLAVKYLFLVDEGTMVNVNTSNDITAFTSPVSASTQTPYFTSPTFSSFLAFSALPHSPSPHPSSPLPPLPKLRMHFKLFSAHVEKNDYEIPWSLRDLIAYPIISYLFHREIEELGDQFGEWNPKTAVLRDVKWKVSRIARLGSVSSLSMSMGMGGYGYGGGSKLLVGCYISFAFLVLFHISF